MADGLQPVGAAGTLHVSVLGATGTIGVQTLDVLARHAGVFQVHTLTGHKRLDELVRLGLASGARRLVVAEPAELPRLSALASAHGFAGTCAAGPEALIEAAADDETQVVMSAIVGAAGLLPTLAAFKAGKHVLIANKEPLVMAGALMMATARAHGARVLPVDSEHNAIFQCLPTGYACGAETRGVERLILTASGGPFRTWSRAAIHAATPAEAVRHPKWAMGPKISVDSASLMNKGLELIEAQSLYRLSPERLDVVVHPESVIHSLVEFTDGSMLAQLGAPDMRVPIAHALASCLPTAGHDRLASGAARLDLKTVARMHFEEPDTERFPCLALARQALVMGGLAPAVLNAANEVAVDAFLEGRVPFGLIPETVADALTDVGPGEADTLDAILAADAGARRRAAAFLARQTPA